VELFQKRCKGITINRRCLYIFGMSQSDKKTISGGKNPIFTPKAK
jgi:hypothetical protein